MRLWVTLSVKIGAKGMVQIRFIKTIQNSQYSELLRRTSNMLLLLLMIMVVMMMMPRGPGTRSASYGKNRQTSQCTITLQDAQ